jgi:hypothetical protein
MRPSHGCIPLAGVMPLAPSFDTVGWVAREAELLAAVGHVLLPADGETTTDTSCVLLVEDGFALADPELRPALADAVASIVRFVGRSRTIDLGAADGGLDALMRCFRTLQAREVWAAHGSKRQTRASAPTSRRASPPPRRWPQRRRAARPGSASAMPPVSLPCSPTAPCCACRRRRASPRRWT